MDVTKTTRDYPLIMGGKEAYIITTKALEAVVLTGSGPRLMELRRPGGENLLFVDGDERHRVEWFLRGGGRVWVYRDPLADEAEETYAPDNQPCEVEVWDGGVKLKMEGDGTYEATRLIAREPGDRNYGIQRIMEIQGGHLTDGLDAVIKVRNTSDMMWSGGLWWLLCTNPKDKAYFIPLGSGHKDWDGFSMRVPMKWAGHTSPVDDEQISMSDQYMLLRPGGTESKRMLEVPRGWMACQAVNQGCTLFLMTNYDRYLTYPHGKCNAAFYVGPDNFMVEMELMGPHIHLGPGETMEMTVRLLLVSPAFEGIGTTPDVVEKEVLASHLKDLPPVRIFSD